MKNEIVKKYRLEQIRFSDKLELTHSFSKIKTIAGIDIAVFNDRAICAVVLLDYKTLNVIERMHINVPAVHYMPEYRCFLEGPIMVEALNKLSQKPDVVMITGHGIIHPRKCGIASYVGLILDVATIGVGKKIFDGYVKSGKVYYEKELRGFEIKTKEFANPIYVSPGNKISPGTALKVATEMIKGHKLPEPLHIAQMYANKIKRKISSDKSKTEIKDSSIKKTEIEIKKNTEKKKANW